MVTFSTIAQLFSMAVFVIVNTVFFYAAYIERVVERIGTITIDGVAQRNQPAGKSLLRATQRSRPPSTTTLLEKYVPSKMESYVIANGRNESFGYDKTPDVGFENLPSGCKLYLEEDIPGVPSKGHAEFREAADKLRKGLRIYETLEEAWSWEGERPPPPTVPTKTTGVDDGPSSSSLSNLTASSSTLNESSPVSGDTSTSATEKKKKKPDLRDFFDDTGTNRDAVCDLLKLHPDGMAGIFPDPADLSRLSTDHAGDDNDGIFLEPLLPPLRHPEFCFEYDRRERAENTNADRTAPEDNPFAFEPFANDRLMDLGFLVHDFAAMCRHGLRKKSRTVFLDMGASLSFHGDEGSPALRLIRLYEKFGFVFDHVYGYELKHHDAGGVYDAIPDDLKASYHWYNVGVESSRDGSYRNPFAMIAETFGPDDFVVVKLDIDSTGIENPLAEQLANDPVLRSIVDVFYYEHHVALKELAIPWGEEIAGSMLGSMELFRDLRRHGIAAHYWV